MATRKKNKRLKALIAMDDRLQWQIAAAAFLPESRLSQIVNGKYVPTPEQAKILAEALGVDNAEMESILADGREA